MGSQSIQHERTDENAVYIGEEPHQIALLLIFLLEQTHKCTTKSELVDINSVGILKLKNSTVESAFGSSFFTQRLTKLKVYKKLSSR